ncbi:Sporulation related domain-containing protein [Paracoccus halophilus]|uniref:Sporulation protein n=1 Tax=Paracoccus halophilus TaxID=376733 RepID=A0A099F3T0_9RHOB|nr:SPOR domain-containing protein [Paracoccus halophilus]KGJ04938.1 sporulation protein [Paracoccus halophilus]SFA39244.1 Sporulation related domain-containing protein [Paracoccus halophilus]
MTVVDFRSSGGFEGSQPNRLSQDYPYAQDAQQDYQDEFQDDGWDERYGYADSPEPLSLGRRLTRLTHYVGALVSVGLIVILAVWGFELVMRDVSGVPVIRAVEGDARTAPEDPGGALTARTGLAVNEVAAGAEPASTDRVALAPQSARLQDQDVAMGELGSIAQEPSHPVELPLPDDSARVIARPDGEAAAEDMASAVEDAVISDVPAVEAAVNDVVTDLAGNEALDVAINTALAQAAADIATPPAVASSARPAPRPRRLAAAAPVAATESSRPATASAPAPAAQTPAPAPAAAGAALAQIGAFDSEALATGEWKRVSGKFGGLFSGKGMVVQRHETNGRTFWRLRASGFASRDEARRFCAALIAGGTDCIPATAK